MHRGWEQRLSAYLACRELLAVNPDNYRHHAALRRAEGLPEDPSAELSDEQQGRMRGLYQQLQSDHPRSYAASRIPLDFEVGLVPEAITYKIQSEATFGVTAFEVVPLDIRSRRHKGAAPQPTACYVNIYRQHVQCLPADRARLRSCC